MALYDTASVFTSSSPLVQVLEILLNSSNVHNPTDKASYPHIRTLLNFDTREFLNVIALVSLST